MSKILDLTKSVHDLCGEYPELAGIMASLGFSEVTKKAALNTFGRMMTIPKGAAMKGIDMNEILETLKINGFQVIGEGTGDVKESVGTVKAGEGSETGNSSGSARKIDRKNDTQAADGPAGDETEDETENDGTAARALDPEERTALLTSYVQRLSEGEDLENVRSEFVANFKDVDAAEIAKAEQTLITSGVPITDVQRLCDVHSALFHGATRNEQIANAERAVQESLQGQTGDAQNLQGHDSSASESERSGQPGPGVSADRDAAPAGLKRQDGADIKYKVLSMKTGHPLNIFALENEAIADQLKAMRKAISDGGDILAELDRTRQISVHYAKKGDLIYPVLKTRYGFSGPSDVMWGVDDEIRDEMKDLAGQAARDESKLHNQKWNERLDKVLTRAEEMVYKEDNILFPLCAKSFSDEEWKQMARDMRGYELCLIDSVPEWKEAFEGSGNMTVQDDGAVENAADENKEGKAQDGSGEISFASGHMTPHQIEAVLNTIPLEITFVDDQNINRFFNDDGQPKLFKRPLAALDREVFTCHPPKIEPMVRLVIEELREGKKDSVDVWNSRGGEPVLIRYMAVRDKEGKYVGTLECVQRMGFAQEHFSKPPRAASAHHNGG